MKKLFALVIVILISIMLVAACQKGVNERIAIPWKDLSIAENSALEAPDDIIFTPGGGTYRANVFQQGVENPWPPIESAYIGLGSGTASVNVSYRDYMETATGEVRNNIIRITKEGGFTDNKLELYSTTVPKELKLFDGGRGVGLPGTLGAILIIEIAHDVSPGEYEIEIGIDIDGKDHGTIKCIVKVI
jgi:hypothetical protein